MGLARPQKETQTFFFSVAVYSACRLAAKTLQKHLSTETSGLYAQFLFFFGVGFREDTNLFDPMNEFNNTVYKNLNKYPNTLYKFYFCTFGLSQNFVSY